MIRSDQRQVRKALRGLEFPADKPTLIAYAEYRRARPKALRCLRALPENDYTSAAAVEQAIRHRASTPTAN